MAKKLHACTNPQPGYDGLECRCGFMIRCENCGQNPVLYHVQANKCAYGPDYWKRRPESEWEVVRASVREILI